MTAGVNFQAELTAPGTYPGAANVVMPVVFERVTIVNMSQPTDVTKIAYVMFSDPTAGGETATRHAKLVPGTPAAGLVFYNCGLNIWVKGDNAPEVQVIAEGPSR